MTRDQFDTLMRSIIEQHARILLLGATRATLRTYVDTLKSFPCYDCGNCYEPEAMDFDHVDTLKRATISQLMYTGRNFRRVVAEVKRCELVCSNCHRVRTTRRRRAGVALPARVPFQPRKRRRPTNITFTTHKPVQDYLKGKLRSDAVTPISHLRRPLR